MLGDPPKTSQGAQVTHEDWGSACMWRAHLPTAAGWTKPGVHPTTWPLTGCSASCLCPGLPLQILKPATFTETTHYPLLLVV